MAKKKLKKKKSVSYTSYWPGGEAQGPWPGFKPGVDYWGGLDVNQNPAGPFPTNLLPNWGSPNMTPEQEEIAKRRGQQPQQYYAPTANLDTKRFVEPVATPGQELAPITQEDVDAPKVSPALPAPFSVNPYALPIGLFNYALNSIGGRVNQFQQRKNERMNNFLIQQPETNYFNKRMLYGDKSMFASKGGQLPKADLGMFLGIDPISSPSISPELPSMEIERFLPPERIETSSTAPANFNTKEGVDLTDISDNLTKFLTDFQSQFPGLKISSGRDGKHKKGSRHYSGRAVDIGANSSSPQDYQAFKKAVLKNPTILQQYGIEDIIDEGDHIHIELPAFAIGGSVELSDEEVKYYTSLGYEFE